MKLADKIRTWPQTHAGWLIAGLGLTILTAILWIPFGIWKSDLLDTWPLMGLFDQGQVGLVASGPFRMRPFSLIPHLLGYYLSPGSLVGLNVVQVVVFWGKGLAMAALARRLTPDRPALAWLMAVLFVLYPADTGLFSMRAVGSQLGALCFVLSIYLLIVYWQKPSAPALIGMWLASLFNLGIKEASYPLVFLAPLLLVWLDGGFSPRLVRVIGLWYLPAVIMFTYASYVFSHPHEGELYQQWVLLHSGLNSTDVLPDMWRSFVQGYRRHFWDGWVETWGQVRLDSPYVYLAAAFAVLAGAISWTLSPRQGEADPPIDTRRYLWLALIGVLAVGAGFVVFVVSPFRGETWRVYYYSSAGGAIAVGALCTLISHATPNARRAFTGMTGLLVGLATLHALNQHAHFAELSHRQQVLLTGIAGQVHRLRPGAHLVVVDESGKYHDNWSLGVSTWLTKAVQYVYADYTLEAILCYRQPDGRWGTLPELLERCDFRAEELVLYQGDEVALIWPYSDIVVVNYSEAGGVRLLERLPTDYLSEEGGKTYQPRQLIDASSPPPPRIFTLFPGWEIR